MAYTHERNKMNRRYFLKALAGFSIFGLLASAAKASKRRPGTYQIVSVTTEKRHFVNQSVVMKPGHTYDGCIFDNCNITGDGAWLVNCIVGGGSFSAKQMSARDSTFTETHCDFPAWSKHFRFAVGCSFHSKNRTVIVGGTYRIVGYW